MLKVHFFCLDMERAICGGRQGHYSSFVTGEPLICTGFPVWLVMRVKMLLLMMIILNIIFPWQKFIIFA